MSKTRRAEPRDPAERPFPYVPRTVRVFRVREHHGYGHGLAPGTDHDMNCLSCKRERAAGQVPVITEEG